MPSVVVEIMAFLNDDEIRKLQRFIEFKIEYPDLAELINSYTVPMLSFIDTITDINDDLEELKKNAWGRQGEINAIIDRIDATKIKMDEYKVTVIGVDLRSLKMSMEDKYEPIIDETISGLNELLDISYRKLREMKRSCDALTKKISKKEVDVFYLDEDKEKKEKK